jgi:hypothetical protein
MSKGPWETYLVEHYRGGAVAEELERLAARIAVAVGQMELAGEAFHYLGSTLVPMDGYFLSTIEAASADLVREAHARAGLPFDRISSAISLQPRIGADESMEVLG